MSHSFGTLLRDLRKRNGLTQESLAARLGFSRPMVAMLEAGKRQPNVEEVIDLYLPALGLEASRDLALQLVELATAARRTTKPDERRAVALRQRMQRKIERRGASHLPAAPTPLLGREREVESISERFLEHEVRLLTLVGPPGVGKTRLAQEVARHLDLFFSEGVHFVPLAGVTDSASVVPSILAALNLKNGEKAPLATLIAHLRNKDILLVLDNFEQILDTATLLAQVQAECSDVQVLVTSRERLRLRAEHIILVRPLPIHIAADLFAQRAQAVNPTLEFTEGDRQLVESICRRLDCLPLAIELCAAQVDFYSPEQLLARIESRPLDTLIDGARDLPPHQHTLRAAIGASYDMLSASERELLTTLAVFAGGASPTMVEQVWRKLSNDPPAELEKVVRSLAAKNLLQVETTAVGERRLILLESIREFGRERLESVRGLAAMQAHHFEVCLHLARECEQNMWNDDGPARRGRFWTEMDNIRAAIGWAYVTGHFKEAAWLLIPTALLAEGAAYREIGGWSSKLLDHREFLSPEVQVRLTIICALDAQESSETNALRERLQELRDLVTQCMDPLSRCSALVYLGSMVSVGLESHAILTEAIRCARTAHNHAEAWSVFGYSGTYEWTLALALATFARHVVLQGGVDEAEAAASESLELWLAQKSLRGAANAHTALGRVALFKADFSNACFHFGEMMRLCETAGDHLAINFGRIQLALAHHYGGNSQQALRLLSDSLEEYREAFGLTYMPLAALISAEVALDMGRIDEARHWAAKCLDPALNVLDIGAWQILRLLVATRLAAADGKDAYAATLYGAAHGYNERIRLGPTAFIRDTAVSAITDVRKRLTEDEWLASFNYGSSLAPDAALCTDTPNQGLLR